MSQSQIIYDFLAKSGNPAADDLLNLALTMSEEPYKSAIFETIIDRGRTRSSAGIISEFHLMDQARQSMIVQRAADLHAPICQAITSQDSKARDNALEIISRSRDCRLASALILLLKSGNYHFVSQATLILVKMVDTYVTENPYWYINQKLEVVEDFDRQIASRGSTASLTEADKRQYLLAALKESLECFLVHRRTELIPAAMMITDARDELFWKFNATTTSPVVDTVSNLIGHEKRAKLAYFICSALKFSKLRKMVLANLSGKNSSEFISSLAVAYSALKSDKEIVRWLKSVKDPVWLNAETVSLAGISREQQRLVIDLVHDVGADQGIKAIWAYNSLSHSDSHNAFALIGMIANPDNNQAVEMLKNINMSANEEIAFEALKHIIFLKPSDLLAIVGKQLSSKHARVRELATRVYQKGAFDIFWKKFEKLDPHSQAVAAKAIFKLSDESHDKWEQQAASQDSANRIKALKVLKNAGLMEEHLETLIRLINDRDPFVRSLAVALVGQNGQLRSHAEEVLLRAANDKDARVQANAIESLDFIQSKCAVGVALQHSESDIPRIRANAIRVLIGHHVDNAWLLFRKMLGDKRPGHQRSARWLAQNTGIFEETDKNY